MRIIDTIMHIIVLGYDIFNPDIKRFTFDVYNIYSRRVQNFGALKRARGKSEMSRYRQQCNIIEELCSNLIH